MIGNLNSPADIALENVEAVLRGEITEPSPGTLAARVLAWADERATRHVPIVTVSYAPDLGNAPL